MRPVYFRIALVVLPLVACDSSMPAEDGPDDTFVTDGKADVYGVNEGSAEACGVVNLVSTADFATLRTGARIAKRAADNIIAYRSGPDGTAGNADDQIFDSLAELDDIKYVGPATFRKLYDYAVGHGFTCTDVDVQVLDVSDWHGQLDPLSIPMVGNVGGAPALATYFQQDRAANRKSLTLTAGDGFGATPPLSSFFGDHPAVEAMNAMRFDADGLGNHNFDSGIDHLQELIDLADYPYLSSNLDGVDDNLDGVEGYRIFMVGGLLVAVVGVTNPDAEMLAAPGAFGSIHVSDPAIAALAARDAAAADGAQVFILFAHMGATGMAGADPVGPLLDLAHNVSGFDLILGDHTNAVVNTTINGTPVVENKSFGASYARIRLHYSYVDGTVTPTVEIVTPNADMVAPDPALVALLAPYRTQLSQQLDGKIAVATGTFERGNNVERLHEMPIGDLVADSMRLKYGSQLGFCNGGGIRAPLPSSYAPMDLTDRRPAMGYAAGPPYDLVIGDIYTVLPFGNSAVTRTVTGAQVWQMMEHSVSALPLAQGFFGQISGFKVTFDTSHPAGSRVVSIQLDDGTDIPNDASVHYTMATSDFIDAGGDGYSFLAGGDGVSRDKMAAILQDYVHQLGTIDPATYGGHRLTDAAAPTP